MAPQFHICVGLGFISMDLGPADLKSTVEFVGEPARCWLGLLVSCRGMAGDTSQVTDTWCGMHDTVINRLTNYFASTHLVRLLNQLIT